MATAEQRRRYNRTYYENGGKEKISDATREQRKKLRAYLLSVKTGAECLDCGIPYPPYVLEYDHRDRTTKKADVSQLVAQGVSLSTLQNEIAKCDLVCANCHRERTFTTRTCSSVGRAGDS